MGVKVVAHMARPESKDSSPARFDIPIWGQFTICTQHHKSFNRYIMKISDGITVMKVLEFSVVIAEWK